MSDQIAEIIIYEFREKNLKRKEVTIFGKTIEDFESEREFKKIEPKLPLHDNLDSDKILLFVDPDNKKVWIWFGKNITTPMKYISARSAQGIIDKYRIEFNKNKKIPRINNAIIKTKPIDFDHIVFEDIFLHCCSRAVEGKEPIDFKIMLGYLPNMNDIEDEEEFERKKIGFPNRIRNETDAVEDQVFIRILIRWENLANKSMKILNKIKDLEEKSEKLIERKKVGEFVKDLLKQNKKELKRLRKKERKLYFERNKELRSEREECDYVICPNCGVINRIMNEIPETLACVIYPIPPGRISRDYFCYNCGNSLYSSLRSLSFKNLKNRLDEYTLRNFTEEDKLVLRKRWN